MANYPLNKTQYTKTSYENVIDTSITQLQPPPPPVVNTVTVEQFFRYYQTLFYNIPKEGPINSHKYLVDQSGMYIEMDNSTAENVQVLLDEITTLRQDLLTANQAITNLRISSSISQ
jgi:hypothetical protein